MRIVTDPVVRFHRFVMPEPNSGCWLWMGALKDNGYAVFNNGKDRDFYAHRFSYRTFRGEIPEGLELDHKCRVRCCVNPDHLEPVSRRENLGRSPIWNGNQTHCKNGHQFTEKNTWIEKNGHRHCRRCHADTEYRRRARRRPSA